MHTLAALPTCPAHPVQVAWSIQGGFQAVQAAQKALAAFAWRVVVPSIAAIPPEADQLGHRCFGLAVWLWLMLFTNAYLPLCVLWQLEARSKANWCSRQRVSALAVEPACTAATVTRLAVQVSLMMIASWIVCDVLAVRVAKTTLYPHGLDWLCPVQAVPVSLRFPAA